MRPDPDAPDRATVDLQTDRPHPARVYDYMLGGKDNFPADRAAAEQGLRVNPYLRTTTRENRAFLQRAVRYLAEEAGIRQFLDIGTGIPTAPNVHQVAQASAPESRIVYVDNDPIVLAHARALLTSSPEGKTAYIDADLRDVGSIFDSPQLRATLDLSQPVGLLLIAVMHFIPDTDDPYGFTAGLLDSLPSGSYLALSHLTADFAPEVMERAADVLRERGVTMVLRSRPETERFFDGLELVEPAVQSVHRWRPDSADASAVSDAEVSVYGGLALKR
jgi:hypothetical protein